MSTPEIIIAAIVVILLVAARIAIQGYGQRIGADEMDFEYRPELEGKRLLYKALKKGFSIATVIASLWIMLLGIQLIAGAQADLFDARRHGAALMPYRLMGALGAAVVLAGLAVIFVPLTLRWDYQPEKILDPRPAFKLRTTPAIRGQSGADFSALSDAVGDIEADETRPALRWYNARPAILWVMVASAGAIFLCYLTLFIAIVPIR